MSDSKEITVQSDPFVDMVERLATNSDVDAEKLDKLVSIQERIMDRNAEQEFNAAMSRVQAKLPTVEKDANNLQTKSMYARHEAISRAIKPIYTAEGFSTSFSEGTPVKEGHIRVNGILRHSAGHSEPYSVELPPDDKGIKGSVNKTNLHAAGSTLTYGRRYLTLLMFDIATGDDTDGNLPKQPITQERAEEIQELLGGFSAGYQARFLKWALDKEELSGEETPADIPAHKAYEAVHYLKRAKQNADA